MRLAAHSARASESAATLALLMGLVGAGGCVEKVVEPPSFPLDGDDGASDGTAGEDGMDAGLDQDAGTGGNGSGSRDAGGNDGQLSCISYCSAVLRTCTDQQSQFTEMQQCVNMCEDWTPGTSDDRSGDTLGCRMWAINRAEDTGDVVEYCNIAGPSGGDVCGERCDVFCKGVTTLCTEENVRADDFEPPYAFENECLSSCEDFPIDARDELPGSGNSVNCRIYHLSLAYRAKGVNDDQLATHCGHTQADPDASGVCKDPNTNP